MEVVPNANNVILIVALGLVGFFLRNLISKIEQNSRDQLKLITQVSIMSVEFQSFQRANDLIITDFRGTIKNHESEIQRIRDRMHDMGNMVHQLMGSKELESHK